MGIRYQTHEPDEWIKPKQKGYRLACCDCGLVHEINFRVVKGKVQFQAERHERATGQKRRLLKKKLLKELREK